jgi:isoquinoline 1-oxidoreductase alpha subunit
MKAVVLQVNGEARRVEADPQTPLLWVLRDHLGLTGTKFGCGAGICGACTVHLDGEATRSCVVPLADAAGHKVTTIEGLSPDGRHPLQLAWIEEDVPQCGYCQAGQIMAAAAFLGRRPHPGAGEIAEAMSGNLCRCGTYARIGRAIARAAGNGNGGAR